MDLGRQSGSMLTRCLLRWLLRWELRTNGKVKKLSSECRKRKQMNMIVNESRIEKEFLLNNPQYARDIIIVA